MLRGVYNRSGGSAEGLEAIRRLRGPAEERELLVRGPLAVAWDLDSSVGCAEVDGITCVIDGYLHEPAELARELSMSATSAAELVAVAYRRLGEEALTKLRGKYSLVLWDDRRQRGVLACDILATQSLFLREGVGWVAFASEVGELLPILPSRPGPDSLGFVSWLAAGSCPIGRTFYDGVGYLGPGRLLELAAGAGPEPRRYWRPSYAGTLGASRTELAEGLREELERSIGKRLSPRSSGVVLSGGLDSSIVTAVGSRMLQRGAKLQTYSTVFPGSEDFDESAKIRSLTTALGIEPAAFEIKPQGALWLGLQHAKRWELPLMGIGSLIDGTMVTEAARDGAEVVLDGQSGDEVFGFSKYLVSDRLMRGRLLAALELARRWPMGEPTTRSQQRRILQRVGLRGAMPYRVGRIARALRLRRRDGAGYAPDWLTAAAQRQYTDVEDGWAWKSEARGPLWWRFLADVLIEAPHRELRMEYLRHRAAGAGVVGETPLYDFDLINHSLRLPPELAFDSILNRPLARDSVQGLVPDDVRLDNQKVVFSSFWFNALAGGDSGGIERLLTAPDAEIGAYADLQRVRHLWHDERPKPGPAFTTTRWGTHVWRLAAGESWLRSQADPDFLDEMLARPDIPAPSVRRVALADSGTFSPLAGKGDRAYS